MRAFNRKVKILSSVLSIKRTHAHFLNRGDLELALELSLELSLELI